MFNRFAMKCFLHEALMFWGYAAKQCLVRAPFLVLARPKVDDIRRWDKWASCSPSSPFVLDARHRLHLGKMRTSGEAGQVCSEHRKTGKPKFLALVPNRVEPEGRHVPN